jgi:AcrR family transcriptional regulator
MMMDNDEPLSPAAERLLTEGMRLFAEQGYARTSVGEIQQAAGLTFGSGALYKHFASKEALLTAGIERFIASGRRQFGLLGAVEDLDLPVALETLARAMLSSFAADSATLRIVWRDLGQFPGLQRRVVAERIAPAFTELTAWLARQTSAGKARGHDSAAVAVVALGSLVFVRLLATLLDATPGDVDEDRLVRGWTLVLTEALRPAT